MEGVLPVGILEIFFEKLVKLIRNTDGLAVWWLQPRSSSGGAQVRINAQVLGQGRLHGGKFFRPQESIDQVYLWTHI